MSHKVPDGENCKNYFKYGKSFPQNVEDALCDIPFGATGPTGPIGPAGIMGNPALLEDILEGDNNEGEFYIDASGWYHASNQYSPLVWTESVSATSYTPEALNYTIFDLTFNNSCIIAEPSNMKNGRTISMVIRQGGAGNNSILFDPAYHFDGGYNSLTFTAGAKDVIVATKINDFLFATMANDCKASD